MSATFGQKFRITLFGESHADAIGVVIDGVPAGVKLDEAFIASEMRRRAPGGELSTARKEADEARVLCGVKDGVTEGTPIAAVIFNTDVRSSDYSQLERLMRPGHADYGYFVKYGGHNDVRGGGASSGRMTAPLVFAGAIAKQLLAEKGVKVGAHIARVADVKDQKFGIRVDETQFEKLRSMRIPVLDAAVEEKMRAAIEAAKADGDSVGGAIECAVTGVPAGVGEPFFESVESRVSALAFSVPAVKAVAFGKGFEVAGMRGSECNDGYFYDGGVVAARTNNNGGVIGGVTNGMPIVFEVAVKPTASIFKTQRTVDVVAKQDAELNLKGRHDPCIVPRAIPVIEAVAAIAVIDLMR